VAAYNESPKRKTMTKVSKKVAGGSVFGLDPDEVRSRWESLTPKEQELLHHFAMGLSNKEIAAAVGISVKTLDVHRANCRRKLQTRPWGFGRYYFAAKSLNLPHKTAAA